MDPQQPKRPRVLPSKTEVEDDKTDIGGAPPALDGEPTEIGAPLMIRPPSAEHPAADRATTETRALDLDELPISRGVRIGEYEVDAKVGDGGMGVVYSAFHPLIGKRAAIKILKKELCADPAQLERFSDEAKAVNHIGHPNIVDIFAFGDMPDGRRYLVMEWLEGETLQQRIDRSRPSLHEVAAVIKPLARALQAAHAKGVIHRDLKPDNIFLAKRGDDEGWTVKLLDFGIAKLARTEKHIAKTAEGAMVGTPQYIAPEQAKGYPIDPRADIYALGGILYQLLTGRTPFIADNAMEMVAKHLMEEVRPPSAVVPGLPPELDQITYRMLSKSPDGRPPLSELIVAIDRAVAPNPFAQNTTELSGTAVPAFETFSASYPVYEVNTPSQSHLTPMRTAPIAPTVTPHPSTVYPVAPQAAAPSRHRLLIVGALVGAIATALLAYSLVTIFSN